mmetsp:Transcript_166656/g.319923  ORF Transcript_166656/g.319923 Transcript_166656/m.319923 type:complete len:385 (+) Transcript_166656:200-1354(+)
MVDSGRMRSSFKAAEEESWAEAIWSQRCWTGNLNEPIVFTGNLDNSGKIIGEGEVWDMTKTRLLDTFTACRKVSGSQAYVDVCAQASLPEICLLSGQPTSSQPSFGDFALAMRISVADELNVSPECVALVGETGQISDMTQMHEIGNTQLHAVSLPDGETRIPSIVQECLASLDSANVNAKVASLASLGIRTAEELSYLAKGFLDVAVQERQGHALLATCVNELRLQFRVPSAKPNGRPETFLHALVSMCQTAYQQVWYPLPSIMRVTALLFAYGFLPKRAAQQVLQDIFGSTVPPDENAVQCVCEFLTTANLISQDVRMELPLCPFLQSTTAARVLRDLTDLTREYHIRFKLEWHGMEWHGLSRYSEELKVTMESLMQCKPPP